MGLLLLLHVGHTDVDTYTCVDREPIYLPLDSIVTGNLVLDMEVTWGITLGRGGNFPLNS